MTDCVCINLSYAVPNDKAAEAKKIFLALMENG